MIDREGDGASLGPILINRNVLLIKDMAWRFEIQNRFDLDFKWLDWRY